MGWVDKMEIDINLKYRFCWTCNKNISQEPIYFQEVGIGRQYCSIKCTEKGWDLIKKLLDIGDSDYNNWEGKNKPITIKTFYCEEKNRIDNDIEMKKFDKYKIHLDKELISMNQKIFENKKRLEKDKKELMKEIDK